MALELDHIFLFVAGDGADAAHALEAQGLVPSYRRAHPGQGTANICYCFDNLYLELLYVTDPVELVGPAVARNQFDKRARWMTTGASPFGLAFRGGPLPGAVWPYRFDGLPPGLSIAVSSASDDIGMPFIFTSPGTARPDRWIDGRAGARQTAAGMGEVTEVRLTLPERCAGHPILSGLTGPGLLSEVQTIDDQHKAELLISGHNTAQHRLTLPLPAR